MTENMLHSSVSADQFRYAMGHFVTGVTVVTTLTPDGEPVGTTANAVTSLSLDPPLLVCFDLDSGLLRPGQPHAAGAIRSRESFAVNVLADDHQPCQSTWRAVASRRHGKACCSSRVPAAVTLVDASDRLGGQFWRHPRPSGPRRASCRCITTGPGSAP
jgi:flavin reductase (DIM6/NTAB) family NADH-FMN oxidoreductase RutF